jgi:hypothetical protein
MTNLEKLYLLKQAAAPSRGARTNPDTYARMIRETVGATTAPTVNAKDIVEKATTPHESFKLTPSDSKLPKVDKPDATTSDATTATAPEATPAAKADSKVDASKIDGAAVPKEKGPNAAAWGVGSAVAGAGAGVGGTMMYYMNRAEDLAKSVGFTGQMTQFLDYLKENPALAVAAGIPIAFLLGKN